MTNYIDQNNDFDSSGENLGVSRVVVKKPKKQSNVRTIRKLATNEISHVESVLHNIASALNTSRRDAIKLIYKLDNQHAGKIQNPARFVGPALERQIQALLGHGGFSLRTFVQTKLPLLELPKDLKVLVKSGHLAPSKALVLASISDDEERGELASRVMQERLTLLEVRALVSGNARRKPVADAALENDLKRIGKALERTLGTRVLLSPTKLEISLVGVEGAMNADLLERVLEALGVEL